jgi:hypothetical protein
MVTQTETAALKLLVVNGYGNEDLRDAHELSRETGFDIRRFAERVVRNR